VFQSTRDGNSELYVMNADGSGQSRLTNDPATDRDPAWSPDGTKIAFSSNRESFLCDTGDPYCHPRATYRIFTMNADGSGVTRITVTHPADGNSDGSDHFQPDWSPSGDRLAYESAEIDYFEEFWANSIVTTGTGGHVLIRAFQGTYPQGGVAWSPDGRYIAWMYDDALYVMSASAGGYGEQIAYCCNKYPNWQPIPINSYPRPRGATPMYLSFVPVYNTCTAPNSQHGAPLSSPSCAPPVQSSGELTLGTADANGKATNSTGFAVLTVQPDNTATPAVDEADVQLRFNVTDVRRRSDLADYTGELQVRPTIRITDKANTPSPGGPGAGTTVDLPFPFTAACTPTAAANVGSTCETTTTAEAALPGAIAGGKRAIWQVESFEVYDGGPDGTASTAPNTAFLRQGLFVP
jgi:dipeptidyl aminopeptidase/acylaminoacyl peptidase